MTTILTATDFSGSGDNAAYYAADLAKALHARLIVCNAVEDTVMAAESAFNFTEDNAIDWSFSRLEALKDKLQFYTNGQVRIEAKIKFGNVTSGLKELYHDEQPLLIVMAATQKHFENRLFTGSNTLVLSKYHYVPLLLIPEWASFTGLNKIAIAVDLSEVYETPLLNKLTMLLQQFTATLDIVTIVKPGSMQACECAEAVTLQTHFNGFNPQFTFIENDDVQYGLNTYTSEAKPDLLIVVPEQHSLLHKSQSKQLILHPNTPLLIIRD